ncbi:MAG: hypothetical protein O2930_03835 [Acidobacteria bacterium]|nr:hypothetical protein [Acidobacteriota bacterium]
MLRIRQAMLALVLAIGLAASAAAQYAAVTPADIQRLQDNAFQALADVLELRGRDAVRADDLQSELDRLREDVIYLKVKLRREETVARAEYADVRDRIEDLRTRARSQIVAAAQPAAVPAVAVDGAGVVALEIQAGTEIDVRLVGGLNSGDARVEDRFEATTLIDVNVGGRTAMPAGSVMRGVVTDVEPATRTNRTARMTVSFDQVTVASQVYAARGTVIQAIEGDGLRGEAGRIGTGAAVGAIIGGILGGGLKGTLAGVLIGAGGTIAATEGRQVELPRGSVLRVRLDSPLLINTPR